MMPFTSELILKDLGDGRFKLLQPLNYVNNGTSYRVPQGFVTDLATVPWFGRWLISVTGRYNKATVLHDYLIQSRGFSLANREIDEAMKSLGVKWWRRKVIYYVVLFYSKLRGL